MSQETARFPGFWRFVWLFLMQPITLHRILRSLDVDPDQSGWKLLRRPRSRNVNWWLLRSAQMFLLITPGVALTIVGLFAVSGRHVNWRNAASAVAGAIVAGVAGGVSVSVAVGVVASVA